MQDAFLSIPFEIVELDSRSYHLMVEGRVNEIPCNLVIDTGASRTVFDRSFFEDRVEVLDVKTDDLLTAGIPASHIETVFARIDRFCLSDVAFDDQQILLIDMNSINHLYQSATGKKVHGLLGCDFLIRHDAIIDLKTRILSLHR